MIRPLVPIKELLIPPNTLSDLSGPFGGVAWKTVPRVTKQYCLDAARGQSRETHDKFLRIEGELHSLLSAQVCGTPQEVAVAYLSNASVALIEILRCSIQKRTGPRHTIIVPHSAYSSLVTVGESMRALCGARLLRPTTAGIIDAIDEHTRVVIIESFDTRRCTMLDLKKIAATLRERAPEARLFVDISQTVGIFPTDLQSFDAAVMTPYKGLGGASNGAAPLLLIPSCTLL
jgi:selenocysteine lyase/cysteine desulfurase